MNACRTLLLEAEGRIGSKVEGGAWALGQVPPRFRPVVEDALRVQAGPRGVPMARELPEIRAFLRWAAEGGGPSRSGPEEARPGGPA